MLRELWFDTVRATSSMRNQFQGTLRLIFLRRLIMIKSAISNTVYTRLVATTSIVAKLAVCAVLIGGAVSCAHAATKKPEVRSPSQAKLAELDRDWKRLHSRSHRGAL